MIFFTVSAVGFKTCPGDRWSRLLPQALLTRCRFFGKLLQMDEGMRASLFIMGNPYAKLSILDDEELAREAAKAQLSRSKRRRSNVQVDATQAYLFELENPYAKLSVLPQEELNPTAVEAQEQLGPLWTKRTQVYQFVSEAFALPFVRTRPPELLKEFALKVTRLGPRAQKALHSRIGAHLPDEKIVYNRLSPNEGDRLFLKLLEMADAVAALDGQKD